MSFIASVIGERAKYIKYRGFGKQYYQDLIVEYLKTIREASRKEIDDLLFDKLPDILTDNQR